VTLAVTTTSDRDRDYSVTVTVTVTGATVVTDTVYTIDDMRAAA
jgi:hypothetical protein